MVVVNALNDYNTSTIMAVFFCRQAQVSTF